MKKTTLGLTAAVALAMGLSAFTAHQTASIKATVIPADASGQVWAISGTDTVKAAFTSGSIAVMNLKTGTYKVVVAGDETYRQLVKENVAVQEGSVTDLGELTLEKAK
jgi:hypothetical protein